jgi:hypothetical protein
VALKSKHIPVHVDAETYELGKAYFEKTGVPVTRVVTEAMKDWLETIGAARLKAFGND